MSDFGDLSNEIFRDAIKDLGEQALADQLVEAARERSLSTVDDIEANLVIKDESGNEYPANERRVRALANEILAES